MFRMVDHKECDIQRMDRYSHIFATKMIDGAMYYRIEFFEDFVENRDLETSGDNLVDIINWSIENNYPVAMITEQENR
jgi:hypothetical protein